jgi:cytosine/adenosine deaminase-related metal-dependent hydrolase
LTLIISIAHYNIDPSIFSNCITENSRQQNLFTGTEMLGPDAVLITDEQGKSEDIINIADAGEDIQKLDGVLSPGFINCHCHLELSHMKGLIPEETGLVDFVFKVVNERHFPDEEILDAISECRK